MNTLFSSYVSGGGYGGYSGFSSGQFDADYADEELGNIWEDFLGLDWGDEDPLAIGMSYEGSEFIDSERDARNQLTDLYSGFQADTFGARKKAAEQTKKFDITSGRTGLISGKRLSGREEILTDSAEEQQSLFSNYLSSRTGLAGTIDDARKDWVDWLESQEPGEG
jgi:hypothetical protein